MAYSSDLHHQPVALTLRPVKPFGFRRQIILTPDSPVVVGRSSRSEAKKLSASVDNALFDCPVISRHHAAIELKLNKWSLAKHSITIKDTHSTHGTSVNGQKLQAGMPFELRLGDAIRIGDQVNRADNMYEGVTVALDDIDYHYTPNKEPTRMTSTRRGISCPSGSEFDEESDDVEELRLSADNTPDHPYVIEDDENVASPRVPPPRSVAVPDTYAESNAVVDDSYPHSVSAHCRMARSSFDDVDNVGYYDSQSSRVHNYEGNEGTNGKPNHDGIHDAHDVDGDGFRSNDLEEQQSDYNEEDNEDDEDDGSSMDCSIDSENSVISDNDSVTGHTTFNQEDGFPEDNEDEGAPEVMSSKRQPSTELGTLGEGTKHMREMEPLDENSPLRPRYDPVHGFQMLPSKGDFQPWVKENGGATPATRPSKWDVPPPSVGSLDPYHHFKPPCDVNQALSTMAPLPIDPISAHDSLAVAPAASRTSPKSTGGKRKADEISADEPWRSHWDSMKTPLNGEPADSDFSCVPIDDAAAFALYSEDSHDITVEPPEPVAKKRKIKSPRTKQARLRAAAVEAGKYAAGALVGSIGLVTLLASPMGARLAEC